LLYKIYHCRDLNTHPFHTPAFLTDILIYRNYKSSGAVKSFMFYST